MERLVGLFVCQGEPHPDANGIAIVTSSAGRATYLIWDRVAIRDAVRSILDRHFADRVAGDIHGSSLPATSEAPRVLIGERSSSVLCNLYAHAHAYVRRVEDTPQETGLVSASVLHVGDDRKALCLVYGDEEERSHLELLYNSTDMAASVRKLSFLPWEAREQLVEKALGQLPTESEDENLHLVGSSATFFCRCLVVIRELRKIKTSAASFY